MNRMAEAQRARARRLSTPDVDRLSSEPGSSEPGTNDGRMRPTRSASSAASRQHHAGPTCDECQAYFLESPLTSLRSQVSRLIKRWLSTWLSTFTADRFGLRS